MKNMFISMKKSQENICAGVFFLTKCQADGLQSHLKRDFNTNFFPVNVEEFSN